MLALGSATPAICVASLPEDRFRKDQLVGWDASMRLVSGNTGANPSPTSFPASGVALERDVEWHEVKRRRSISARLMPHGIHGKIRLRETHLRERRLTSCHSP